MERLELAISGAEQVLRPAASPAMSAQSATDGRPPTVATTTTAPPTWLDIVRQQLPRVMEALGAEDTTAGDCALAARSRRLARERNRLLRRLRLLAPALSEGCLPTPDEDHEELRRVLLRLFHDISHHHQRVNDMVYDVGWRDVGGSE